MPVSAGKLDRFMRPYSRLGSSSAISRAMFRGPFLVWMLAEPRAKTGGAAKGTDAADGDAVGEPVATTVGTAGAMEVAATGVGALDPLGATTCEPQAATLNTRTSESERPATLRFWHDGGKLFVAGVAVSGGALALLAARGQFPTPMPRLLTNPMAALLA